MINWQDILDVTIAWLQTTGLRIGLILVGGFIVMRIVRWIIIGLFRRIDHDDSEGRKRAETLSGLARTAASVAILIVLFVTILGELGVAIGPVLATAGVAGLAIGFGAQQLVADVISGFFILLEDQVRVGDVVNVAGKGGLVEKVGLRSVVLRDLAGNVHYVRNSQIDVVTNMTKDYSRFVFDIGVSYREDVDQVMAVAKEVHDALRQDPEFSADIIDDLEVLGVDQFANSAVIIKARTKTKPIQQWRVAREFNRRLKYRFDELGIEIPFPHQTIYFGQDKDGSAPPVRVQRNDPGE